MPTNPVMSSNPDHNALLDSEARRLAQVLDVSVTSARRSLENLLARGLIRLPTASVDVYTQEDIDNAKAWAESIRSSVTVE